MTTRIEITYDDTHVRVHVEDDTGRDQSVEMPRYPAPGSEQYVAFADALDVMMFRHGPEWQARFGDPNG